MFMKCYGPIALEMHKEGGEIKGINIAHCIGGDPAKVEDLLPCILCDLFHNNTPLAVTVTELLGKLDRDETEGLKGIGELMTRLDVFLQDLVYVHMMTGFVHNDFHTQNIIWDNEMKQFKLIDYGRSNVTPIESLQSISDRMIDDVIDVFSKTSTYHSIINRDSYEEIYKYTFNDFVKTTSSGFLSDLGGLLLSLCKILRLLRLPHNNECMSNDLMEFKDQMIRSNMKIKLGENMLLDISKPPRAQDLINPSFSAVKLALNYVLHYCFQEAQNTNTTIKTIIGELIYKKGPDGQVVRNAGQRKVVEKSYNTPSTCMFYSSGQPWKKTWDQNKPVFTTQGGRDGSNQFGQLQQSAPLITHRQTKNTGLENTRMFVFKKHDKTTNFEDYMMDAFVNPKPKPAEFEDKRPTLPDSGHLKNCVMLQTSYVTCPNEDDVPQFGGKRNLVHVLGRSRRVVMEGRKKMVKVNGVLVLLSQAIKLDKQKHK